MRCCGEKSQDGKLGVEESAPEGAAHVMVRLLGEAYRAGPALNAFTYACSKFTHQGAIPPSLKYFGCASRSGPKMVTGRMCALTRVQGSSCAVDPCCAMKAAISPAELPVVSVGAAYR